MPETAVIATDESLRTVEVDTPNGPIHVKAASNRLVEDGFLNVYRDGRVVATFSAWRYATEVTNA